MPERSFETRLEEAFGRYTAASTAGIDPGDVADVLLAEPPGGPDRVTRHRPRRGIQPPQGEAARTLAIAAALGLLLLAIVAFSLLGGTRPNGPLGDTVPSTAPNASLVAVAPTPAVTHVPIADGEPWIVYTDQIGAAGTDRLWLVRPEGTDRHQLATGLEGEQEHPDWSHDGRFIAFDRALPDSATQSGDPVRDLWVINADGSGARPVAACELPCYQLAYPTWSRDDRFLLVSRFDALQGNTWGPGAIEIVDVASGDRRTVIESADGSISYHNPRFSPDGTEVVFVIERFTDDSASQRVVSTELAIVPVDGTAAPRTITDPALGADEPDWNTIDGRIVFHTHFDIDDPAVRAEPTELMTVLPDGTGLTTVTDFALGERRALLPSWTSDGRRILFTLVDGFGSEQLPVVAFVNDDGTGLTRLGFGTGSGPRLRPTTPATP